MKRLAMLLAVAVLLNGAGRVLAAEQPRGVNVGMFAQEVRSVYREKDGLPDNDVRAVEVLPGGDVYAGTAKGLARFVGGTWRTVDGVPSAPISSLGKRGNEVIVVMADTLFVVRGNVAEQVSSLPSREVFCVACGPEGAMWLGTENGLFRLARDEFRPVGGLNTMLGAHKSVHQIAADSNGDVGVAAESGLFLQHDGRWGYVAPREGNRSWAPHNVRGVTFDGEGQLWFASAQGAGCLGKEREWRLFTGAEGLPYDDFTMMASGEEGVVWFGTRMGAIRYDGESWLYRQGPRWLPDDNVRDIAVAADGTAWFATPNGVGRIERRPMTLAEKARHYEEIIDARHRRTPYGYVLECSLARPGDTSEWSNHDSDNDGLWTAMYGAGECFAYAATRSDLARKRARKAFEALRFLSDVTQGGEKPALPGFPARSILPTSGPNPNETHYTIERDKERKRRGDPQWKVMWPRWPKSADGTWYWKCDTSSDELDGHYFFNAVYYDLVAETESEKEEVRKVILATTDHMIEHGFNLVDWDGKPTRWAVFGPKDLNHNPVWYEERGLNSLSMLSYLAVAEHVSGDPKYRRAADELIRDHSYHLNTMIAKMAEGPGTGNQSDDEMAIMSFYNLVNYETDPDLSQIYRVAFWQYWERERREKCPFFNFAFGGVTGGRVRSPWGSPFGPRGLGLEEAVDELKRFPLDLINWPLKNSHRKDIVPHPLYPVREGRSPWIGYLRDGYVLPVDNRHFNHWNHNPWVLDYGGDGRSEADGAIFLLPYYMGLYHGFIVEE
jgi:hypothetical protein